jgi:hypothetical protein
MQRGEGLFYKKIFFLKVLLEFTLKIPNAERGDASQKEILFLFKFSFTYFCSFQIKIPNAKRGLF